MSREDRQEFLLAKERAEWYKKHLDGYSYRKGIVDTIRHVGLGLVFLAVVVFIFSVVGVF